MRVTRRLARLALVLVAVLGTGCAQPVHSCGGAFPAPPTTYSDAAADFDGEGFTWLFAEALAQRVPEGGCADADARTVECRTARVSLEAVWGDCLEKPLDCDATVNAFMDDVVTALREHRGLDAASREHLRLAIRTRPHGEQVATLIEGAVIRHVVGEFVAIVMVDSLPMSRVYGAADAGALGLSSDQAHAAALENTLAELAPLPNGFPPSCGNVLTIKNGYYYESTRLLDPRLVGAVTTTRPPLLVALPAYDTVLIGLDCGADARFTMSVTTGVAGASSTIPLSPMHLRVAVDGITPLPP
ncbi:MAG: hypothetical protein R3B40_31070 [Polyangiales bacterium]|nr:hypothetical protein [Sandaracinaceae bacterium]